MTTPACGATEARCVCVLPADHEGPHECDPDGCGGSWTFDEDGEFVPVRYPTGIDPATYNPGAAFTAWLDYMCSPSAALHPLPMPPIARRAQRGAIKFIAPPEVS